MNIFAIERDEDGGIDWTKSAQSQDNYRVVKMILESTQMLCTTLNLLHGEQVTRYKNAHVNHPSTKWVRESSDNFESLVYHTLAMMEEYTERFNKIHKCSGVLNEALEHYDPSMFPSAVPTPLPLCMPDDINAQTLWSPIAGSTPASQECVIQWLRYLHGSENTGRKNFKLFLDRWPKVVILSPSPYVITPRTT
jgi:hypothetical protein